MKNQAIIVDELSKRYRIDQGDSGPHKSKYRLSKLLLPFDYLFKSLREPSPEEILWALKEVSFSVREGEVLGVIGRNGAGKSTLLKILSRITEPSSGKAIINGRVGSLLEVGTGFHPELTGRENIYLSGAIMGMKKDEIDRKFDEIAAFAETERFLDTPVKRYSSGMYVRLAFAVAAHLEPEILLVDEVLAVGDTAFQKKCLGKMGDVALQGRTVLFVSHNMVAVQNLCQRAIWLDQGRVLFEDEVNKVVSNYLSSAYSTLTEQVWPDQENAPGNERVRLRRVCVRPADQFSNDPISMSSPITIEIEYWNLVPDALLHVCLHIFTEQNMVAFTTAVIDSEPQSSLQPKPVGLYRSVCQVPAYLLNSGLHRITLLILRNTSKIVFRLDDALSFEVLDLGKRSGAWFGKEPGAVRPILDWNTEQLK